MLFRRASELIPNASLRQITSKKILDSTDTMASALTCAHHHGRRRQQPASLPSHNSNFCTLLANFFRLHPKPQSWPHKKKKKKKQKSLAMPRNTLLREFYSLRQSNAPRAAETCRGDSSLSILNSVVKCSGCGLGAHCLDLKCASLGISSSLRFYICYN